MLGKLLEARKQAEEIKTKLAGLKVTGEGGNGLVKIRMDGNKKIDAVMVDDQLLNPNAKVQMELFLQEALENAMQQADNISQAELKHLMGNIPGLGNLLK